MDEKEKEPERRPEIGFTLRMIHNQIKSVIHKTFPVNEEKRPQSQLQGGILGYLYHHESGPVYQKDIEKAFRITGATASNTLQVMEKNGLIVRRAQDRDARLKRILLTREAAQNHARVEEHMEKMDRRMLRGMSEAEVTELNRLLGILMKNLEEMEIEVEEGRLPIGQRGREEKDLC